MSSTVEITAGDRLKEGDLEPQLVATLKTALGADLDLSNAAVVLLMRRGGKHPLVSRAAVVGSTGAVAATGVLSHFAGVPNFDESVAISDGIRTRSFGIINDAGGGTDASHVDYGGGPTPATIAARWKTAIDLTDLDLTTLVVGDTTELTNDLAGADGNVLITTDLASGVMTITGMTGGADAGASSGGVTVPWASPDTDVTGHYDAEFEVTYAGGKVETVPGAGVFAVVIAEHNGVF